MTAIIDYGVGNLFSVSGALELLGVEYMITKNKNEILKAERVILPGVGAFGDAMAKLNENGLVEVLQDYVNQDKPLIGICLGMQLLFEKGYEYGEHNGLGFIKGSIYPLNADIKLKIPQMGWNSLDIVKNSPILTDVKQNEYVYFVHSFYAKNCMDYVNAYTQYGINVPAVVSNKNVYGCQFHPEKSGDTGLKILKNFCDLK